MTENKTCWNCEFRELDISLPPCSNCDDLFRDKWGPREK